MKAAADVIDPARIADNKYIGQPVPRLEDPPLVTGRGRFAGDISFPHQLHMRIARSPLAHGTIVAVDTAAARALPGVVAVWTAAGHRRRAADRFPRRPHRAAGALPPAGARERQVRYVGEPVAAVFATDPYHRGRRGRSRRDRDRGTAAAARRRAGARRVLRRAATPSPRWCARVTATSMPCSRRPQTVVELDLSVGRHSGVPLETRGAIGRYDASRDILELYGAAKVPHRNRDLLARMLRPQPVVDPCARRPMSAAASASAASSIPRTSWCASPRCGSGGRSNGSRTAASICWPPTIRASSATRSAPRSMPRAASSPSTTSSGTTRAPMCAPRRSACR